MGLAEWDDSYSVGIKKIDDQHKKLFGLINELNMISLGRDSEDHFQKILEKILEYTIYHFHTEEEIMRKYDFPSFEAHKSEHDKMREDMKSYYDMCLNEDYKCINLVLERLIDWLHTHLARSDFEYANYLKDRGIT